jgi:glutathione S-transferase
MELFYAPGSSSLLPHVVLYEAELPFEAIKVDERSKAISGGGDYRSVNPLGYVPALALDDGTLLTERAAIVQYLADLVPWKRLAPPYPTIERVRLQAWLNFFASEMHKSGFSPLFYKGVPEKGRNVFRARLRDRFAHLDRHLSSNEHLMGAAYSVADAHFFVVSNWASWVNVDLSPYRALDYRPRLGCRPAVIAALRWRTHAMAGYPASLKHRPERPDHISGS